MNGTIYKIIVTAQYFMFIILCCHYALYSQAEYVGVNLAGADFGEDHLPGIYNKHYTYPTDDEVDYFVDKGMTVFRLPFRWERLQYSANANFDAAELARIDGFVNYAASKNASVIIDPHNYARYYGNIIGSDALPTSAFEDFWQKLALHFKDNPKVIFALMNEPNSMPTELWLAGANAAIKAIRSTGAVNLILVPGNGWSGAHSWNHDWYGTPNGIVMQGIVDPINNYAFDVHQYLDDDSSGTSPECVSVNVGASRLRDITSWLRKQNKQALLGEFAGGRNDNCLAALDNMLSYIDENSDVWLGWTYWAAGPWWGDDMFTLEPKDGIDRPQMSVLQKHIGKSRVQDFQSTRAIHFSLAANYPNPFNSSTLIEFEILNSADVRLTIYNALGRNVISLVNNHLQPDRYKILWNACDASGKDVVSGIYFCSLKYGKKAAIFNKMMLLR